jgi:hypothetical protein
MVRGVSHYSGQTKETLEGSPLALHGARLTEDPLSGTRSGGVLRHRPPAMPRPSALDTRCVSR